MIEGLGHGAEEVKLTPEEEEAEAGVRQATQAAESAVWRLTEGRGEGLDAISASRSARGRLDFVLQACHLHFRTPLSILGQLHSGCDDPRLHFIEKVQSAWIL